MLPIPRDARPGTSVCHQGHSRCGAGRGHCQGALGPFLNTRSCLIPGLELTPACRDSTGVQGLGLGLCLPPASPALGTELARVPSTSCSIPAALQPLLQPQRAGVAPLPREHTWIGKPCLLP